MPAYLANPGQETLQIMATVKTILDKRYAAKDGYPIKIRINIGDKQRNISIGYRVKETQWNGTAVIKHADATLINGIISEKLNDAKSYLAHCKIKGIAPRIELIGSGHSSRSFIEYLNHRAAQYKAKAQIVMDRKLRRFAKDLSACFKRDVFFDDINQDVLRTFEAYLIKKGNNPNTRHKTFKFLRQFYEQAIGDDKAEGKNPFKQYTILMKPVKKEKLSKEDIGKIENIPLASGPVNDTRNMFMFSYLAKGTRFENCLTLQHKQISNGRIMIKTNKGGKHITIKIHPRLQKILSQYKGKGLVFPFLKKIPDEPTAYLRAIDSNNVIVNRHLKVIAALCEIKINLTFHIARHSLAYHLKDSSESIHVIKDVLGHSDTRTTEIYLQSLGDERLDVEMDKVYGG